jgi:hypothetical protein
MAEEQEIRRSSGDSQARRLATTTNTVAQPGALSPRWLVQFLPWTLVEAGVYRVNRTASDAPVRSGHHCAQPSLRRFGLETSVRTSLAVYNTRGDVDALTDSLRRLTKSRGVR